MAEKTPTVNEFKVNYPDLSGYPETLINQWLSVARSHAPRTRDKDIREYAILLYAAWLGSVRQWTDSEAETTKNRDITLSSNTKTFGDRTETQSFISGNQLIAIRSDPKGYKACWDELMSGLRGKTFIASIGPGHLR